MTIDLTETPKTPKHHDWHRLRWFRLFRSQRGRHQPNRSCLTWVFRKWFMGQ
jgi:hypothetical protein